MNVTFKNQQYGDHEWLSFKVEKMMTAEAEAVEGVTGRTIIEWGQALLNGSTVCCRALVWILLKRENPALKFRDVSYEIGAFKVELDDEEKAKLRVELARNDDLTDEEKQQIMMSLGESDLELLDFDPAAAEPDGPGNDTPATENAGESG